MPVIMQKPIAESLAASMINIIGLNAKPKYTKVQIQIKIIFGKAYSFRTTLAEENSVSSIK